MKVTFNASGEASSATGCAFLLEHETGTRQNKTIDELETLTGFDFFTNVPSALQTAAEAQNTPIW